MKVIETERLLLRPLTANDANDVFEWVSDPVVNTYMSYNLYTSVKDAETWISSIKGDNHVFAFVLKKENKVIGSGSICFQSDSNAYELGYNLNKNYWNKGYTSEASLAMIQWAYEELGVRDFVANHANANVASAKILLKCGFKFSHYGQYSKYDGSETFDASYYFMHKE